MRSRPSGTVGQVLSDNLSDTGLPLIVLAFVISLALIVVALGAGATAALQINDAGFGLTSRLFGISEKDTLSPGP